MALTPGAIQRHSPAILAIGAPPDVYNPHGQDWGLAAFHPRGADRFKFRSLSTDLAIGNALCRSDRRIDHALGLYRLFLIPTANKTSGGYVRLPFRSNARRHRAGKRQCALPRHRRRSWHDPGRRVRYVAGLGVCGLIVLHCSNVKDWNGFRFTRRIPGQCNRNIQHPRSSDICSRWLLITRSCRPEAPQSGLF